MTLADQYRAQAAWRNWPQYLARLPLAPAQRVLDIGCGTGEVAALLAGQVAEVVGIDHDPALLAFARKSALGNCRFVHAGASDFTVPGGAPVDGIWSSFLAAYFPNLSPLLAYWKRCLKPGGWLALVEIDAMLAGHGPLPADVRNDLVAFGERARAGGSYDFDMGRRLAKFASSAGFRIEAEFAFDDAELAFHGPAAPEVETAWRQRFERMSGLKRFLGDARFAEVQEAFLASLVSGSHACEARVVLVVARQDQ